jgi:rubrerythrin
MDLLYKPQTKIVCTKCGSDEIYIEISEIEKMPAEITLDEMVENQFRPQPAIYRPTTWRCKKCGYSFTK